MTNVLDRLEEAGLTRRVRRSGRAARGIRRLDGGAESRSGTRWWNELGEQEAGVVWVLTAPEQRRLNSLLRKLLAGFGDGDNWDEDTA